MTNHEQHPVLSALNQIVTRDGKSVSIEIFRDDDGWVLEVVDEYGNSTVWDASFDTEQDALAAALGAIDIEGIDTLIGEPWERDPAQPFKGLLTEAEFKKLDNFLASLESSMDIATLEGFLTAAAIGPRLVSPSEWLPWVWDMNEGRIEPDFRTQKQASEIVSLLLRLYNAVLESFATDPRSFEPVFYAGALYGPAEWCEGFMSGSMFETDAWNELMLARPPLLAPFMRLAGEDGTEFTSHAEVQRLADAIVPALVKIHSFWLGARSSVPSSVTPVRAAPKIGRNDPCPCGSGKKFKKCCGADATPSSLH